MRSCEDVLMKPMISADVEIVGFFYLEKPNNSPPVTRKKVKGGNVAWYGFS